MKKILCKIKGHKRGYSVSAKFAGSYKNLTTWVIRCSRCGYEIQYKSPMARLISKEMEKGFDGK